MICILDFKRESFITPKALFLGGVLAGEYVEQLFNERCFFASSFILLAVLVGFWPSAIGTPPINLVLRRNANQKNKKHDSSGSDFARWPYFYSDFFDESFL